MLVIDPRHTEFARDADVWLNINPGTDAVLAMGFIRQLLEEGITRRLSGPGPMHLCWLMKTRDGCYVSGTLLQML
jgi:anaerobic selenocysteine-containing dehydrogenase